jgi:branched-subunit amino acid transport protein
VSALAVFVLAAVGTYALRASMLVGLAGRSVPAAVQARLALVGPAALAALCAASLAPGPGRAVVPADVLAAAAAFVAVRRSGSVVHAFVVGLPVLWLAHAAGLS